MGILRKDMQSSYWAGTEQLGPIIYDFQRDSCSLGVELQVKFYGEIGGNLC